MIPTLEHAKTWSELRGQMFCNNMRRATVVLIPQVIILGLAWSSTPLWLLLSLAVSIVLLHGWRGSVIRRGVNRTATDEQWDRLCVTVSRITFLHGVWTGLAAALLIPNAGPIWGVGIAIIILGIQAGAIATLSLLPSAFWGFGLPLFVGFSFGWFRISSELALVIVPLYLLLLFVLLAAARNFYQLLQQSWELRAERNRALANAEEANRQKTRFLAAASHDLRQPAAALGFMAEELSERDLPDDLRPIAVNIQHSSDNIRILLDKLFDLSRLDTSPLSNSPKWVSLHVLADALNAMVQSRNHLKGLNFKFSAIDGQVWADPAHLQCLLSNLLDNALKYTNSGCIELSMNLIEDKLCISVRDTGSGIAPAQLDQVWAERIQGSDLSEKQAEFSLGLGLSIVKRLAQLIGARTQIESELGQGTVVHVTFSSKLYSAAANAPDDTGTAHGKLASLINNRLLLVEDNPDLRDALGRHLSRLGFEVDIVADAMSARKQLSSAIDYTLMITDYRLPDNEIGTSLIHYANNDGHELPCLLISADDIGNQIPTDVKLFKYLRKPIQSNELRQALEALLPEKFDPKWDTLQ